MEITKEILEHAAKMWADQLEKFHPQIAAAFSANDEILEIAGKSRLSFVKGKLKMQTTISFTESKVKDADVAYYDPDQMTLEFGEPVGAEGVDVT